MQRAIPTLMAGLALLASLTAQSQNEQPKPTVDRDPPQAVWKDPRHLEQTTKAWEKITDEQYVEAEEQFVRLLERFKDPFERSQVMFGLAQVKMMTDQFDEALRLYEEIVNMDVLQNKPHFDAMFQIAQLFYMRERYDDALRWIDRFQRESGEERTTAYELKAAIYAQMDQFRPALTNIDKAISMEDDPKESWYQLKLAMHHELQQFPEARDVLEVLVRRWPDKRQYWVQLASINVTLKNDTEALAVMALAHRKNLLETETDWMQLFNLYGYLDIPFKAAEVLSAGIEKGIVEPDQRKWEQLGNAWYAAQELEQAVEALKKAAELSLDGKLDMQVAYILVDQERWAEAKASLSAAIEKDGLTESQTGNMYVLLGMSELNSGDETAARQAFRQARQYERSRNAAQQWINHLDELASARTGP